jgi:hypothetical protein
MSMTMLVTAPAMVPLAGHGALRHRADGRSYGKRQDSDDPGQTHGLAPSRHGRMVNIQSCLKEGVLAFVFPYAINSS